MKNFLLMLLVFIGLAHYTFAAPIHGYVYDVDSVPVQFAQITLNGTDTFRLTTNGDGYFEAEIPNGNYKLECTMRGYETLKQRISIQDSLSINLILNTEKAYVDPNVVVITSKKGEDPAYAIMRQVIAHRKEHEKLLKTFESDVYVKGAIKSIKMPKTFLGQNILDSAKLEMPIDSNGKGTIYLVEERSHYYYQAPNKTYNYVQSVHESGDSKGLGFAQLPAIINVYNNNIQILKSVGARGFISPASSNAFFYYKFKYLGTIKEGDQSIYKIQVIPKRKYEPVFSGVVYVVDGDWMFKNLDLKLDHTSQLTTLDSMTIAQNYRNTGNGIWIIDQQVVGPYFSLLGFAFGGKILTSYEHEKINQAIDPKIFNQKIVAAYDSNALKYNVQAWDSLRNIPLEKEEIKTNTFMDSIRVRDSVRTDSLAAHSKHRGNPYFAKGSLYNLHYNTLEGMNYTLSPTVTYRLNSEDVWENNFDLRYGFINKHFNILYNPSFRHTIKKYSNSYWELNGSFGRFVYQLNNDNPISPFLNDISTLIFAKNYMKLYEAKRAYFNFKQETGTGLSYHVFANYENRTAMENEAFYSFKHKHEDKFTENNPILFENHKAAIVGGSISYQPGWKYIQYPDYLKGLGSQYPTFTVAYSKGISGLFGSKSNFDKWSVQMEHSINLKLLGQFDYNLIGGGFFNRKYVGVPDMNHLFGDQTIIANPYLNSFQMAPYYQFSNVAKIYGEGHAEWHLNGWLSNKIPLFRRLNWFFVGATNVLYINKDQYYYEISGGIENIGFQVFRFGRIDLVAGYSSLKDKPMVGVRIGLGDGLWRLMGIHKPSK